MEIDLIIKIGGSCLSNKMLLYKALKEPSEENIKAAVKIDLEIIDQIAAEIGQVYFSKKRRMIVLTGVGAPGHFTVLKYNMHKGDDGTLEQHLGLVEAQIAVNNLRQANLKAFLHHKIPAVQVYASSIYQSDKMRIIESYTENFEKFIELGIVPIISGDMVPDRTMGYSVLSGDQILLDLATKFQPRRVIFGSDVDGLYDSDPKINRNAKLIPKITQDNMDGYIGEIKGDDASGQLKGKIQEIKNLLEAGFKDITLMNLTQKGRLLDVLEDKNVPMSRFT
ncbi:MAG: hypothetical protein EAX86_02705 [Candidatus Heimdallarchaeota archaeon]|nr:hypothetical protein [Candidatus Heimdallarchaeota archaeon]